MIKYSIDRRVKYCFYSVTRIMLYLDARRYNSPCYRGLLYVVLQLLLFKTNILHCTTDWIGSLTFHTHCKFLNIFETITYHPPTTYHSSKSFQPFCIYKKTEMNTYGSNIQPFCLASPQSNEKYTSKQNQICLKIFHSRADCPITDIGSQHPQKALKNNTDTRKLCACFKNNFSKVENYVWYYNILMGVFYDSWSVL